MTDEKIKLIDQLNKDLEWEYAAAIQYIQHIAVMTGVKYDSIKKELQLHADQEIQHAKSLSEQIDSLGGIPTVKVEERKTSQGSLEMLKQDLEGETRAVKRYKNRIALAEKLQEYGLRRALEDILIQEEEHERDLQDAISEQL